MRQLPVLIVGAALALNAQQIENRVEIRVPPPGAGAAMHTMEFMRSEFGPVGPVVKNAPYTAEAVTENVQILADGNRIVHKNTSQVARDSEGRTRRDLTMVAAGPLSGTAPKVSIIYDPVANVSYTLDHNAKTARKMPGHGMVYHSGPPGGIQAGKMVRVEVAGSPGVTVRDDVIAAAPAIRIRQGSGKTESLGKQNIEGVVAEGTRTVDVIPAGEIGNERPIEVVSERWYAPELQTVVSTRHKDPRMGESTYKLVGVRRAEPLKSLFEVPADYTVKEAEVPAMPLLRHAQPRVQEKE
jgi:hypothetical protein